ncbi:hypothetical protein CsSME_00001670 [Camellia sinensis var. sinensis]
MGKTSRWFRALIGSKKSSESESASSSGSGFSRPTKEKKKWGFQRSVNHNDHKIGAAGTKGSQAQASSSAVYVEAIDANKQAIAVAAATAAVAEAALAAAQAAAEVVRLTSGGGTRPATAYVRGSLRRRELAAVQIQSAFRAYLARRALRALKGLVRLQALVRGHIVRKRSADMLRCMQALARIQARACANRAHVSESSHSTNKSSQSCNLGLATPKIYDNQLRAYGSKSDWSPILKSSQSSIKIKSDVDQERTNLGSNWLDRWMEECTWNSQVDASLKIGRGDDESSDKILEVDTWKPRLNSKISRTAQHVTACNYNDQGLTIFDPLSRQSTKALKQNPYAWTSENSASSRPGSSGRRGSFSPARSKFSRSFFDEYLGYPNYMATTESSLAKIRSQSAPRQRLQVEDRGSTTRFARGFWDVDTISERGSALHSNLRTKAYPDCGRLDRPGIPVRGNITTTSYNGRS